MQRIDNKLIADDGMTLTNGEAFGKTVWLASGDDGSKWSEVTDADAKEMKQNQEVVLNSLSATSVAE